MKVWILYRIGWSGDETIYSTKKDAENGLDLKKRKIYRYSLDISSSFDEAVKKAEEEFSTWKIKEIELD